MKHILRDYPCSPQGSLKGPELGEWEYCYQDEKHILNLACQIKERNNAVCLKLPFDDYVEAEVFGAQVDRSDKIPKIRYKVENSRNIIQGIGMSEVAPINQILKAVKLSREEPLILQVQAPFSILAYLIEPMVLFKKLLRNPEDVKNSLYNIEKFLEGYIKSAIENGADIISISDPCASVELLGEENYRIYSATPIVHLLKQIEPWLDRSMIHLCPRCSSLLEQLGLFRRETFEIDQKDLQKALISISQNPSIHFTGHQCIHKSFASKIHLLSLA